MANWKRHERMVASAMGVKRRSRGANFSEAVGDTTPHPVLSIECKFRTHLPKFLIDGLNQARNYDPEKIPALFSKQKGQHGCIVSVFLSDFIKLLEAYENECNRSSAR